MSAMSAWADRPEQQQEVTTPHTTTADGRVEHFFVRRDGKFECSVCTGETPIELPPEPPRGKVLEL